ncbi:phosphonoacetaldehyde hydrolase [Candidatus Woesearchaeota archaeon]|nr:phosphonoacetaldehyde hydrolase [Candidatus Woesearchaeota archaeon]
MANKLEMVILDWAGTTIDYGCFAPTVAFVEACRQMGFDLSTAEARIPMGLKKDEHIREFLGLGERYKEHPLISGKNGVVERWTEQFGKAPQKDDAEGIFSLFISAQIKCLPKYTDLIPGTLETVEYCRKLGLKIGSTTGYMGNDAPTYNMMTILLKEAEKLGYVPDVSVCATGHVAERGWERGKWNQRWKESKVNLPQARPAPWMCLENAKRMNIYPFYKCVKVDDTVDGISEGVNAGMWTIGLIKTSSDMGLTEAEVNALPKQELEKRLKLNYDKMKEAGANYIVDGIWNVPEKIEEIQRLVKYGGRP